MPFFNRRRSSAVLFASQLQHNADYAVYHVTRIPAKAVENAVFLAKLKENSSTKILKQFGGKTNEKIDLRNVRQQ